MKHAQISKYHCGQKEKREPTWTALISPKSAQHLCLKRHQNILNRRNKISLNQGTWKSSQKLLGKIQCWKQHTSCPADMCSSESTSKHRERNQFKQLQPHFAQKYTCVQTETNCFWLLKPDVRTDSSSWNTGPSSNDRFRANRLRGARALHSEAAQSSLSGCHTFARSMSSTSDLGDPLTGFSAPPAASEQQEHWSVQTHAGSLTIFLSEPSHTQQLAWWNFACLAKLSNLPGCLKTRVGAPDWCSLLLAQQCTNFLFSKMRLDWHVVRFSPA